MGLLDWIRGTKAPAPHIYPRSPADVRAALLAVNRPTAPFVVRDGADAGVDLVAEWKIVDQAWWAVFDTLRITKVFRILVRIDGAQNEVRSSDEEWEVRWHSGVPSLTTTRSWGRGQMTTRGFGPRVTYTEHGELGESYDYTFDTRELKTPLQDAVTGCGWTWRGVLLGKL